jgi:hypothetical protein
VGDIAAAWDRVGQAIDAASEAAEDFLGRDDAEAARFLEPLIRSGAADETRAFRFLFGSRS